MKGWISSLIGRSAPDRTRAFRTRLEFIPLEDRLTPSWGAVPPAIIAPPINSLNVPLNQNDASGSAAITANENDFYGFIATATGDYTFSATATAGSAIDTVLAIYDYRGRRINYNDDIDYGNYNSAVGVSLTAGSRYFFGVTNFAGGNGGDYSWAIDGPTPPSLADDAFEENDTFATASNLGTLAAPRTISGLRMADGADYFRFTTTGTGAASAGVNISFANGSGDLDLKLLDASGATIALSNSTSNSESISLSGLSAGTYTALIYGYQGAFNTNYTLTIDPNIVAAPVPTPTPLPPPPPPPPPPATGNTFNTIYGYGKVNAAAAVAGALGTTTFADVANFGGSNDWNLNSVNAPEVWARGYTGAGIVVAVVDTGVDYTHPDLDGSIWTNTREISGDGIDNDGNGFIDDTRGWDFVSNDNTPIDENNHGTHVAGTIAGENNGTGVTGVAYGAKIMPVRVLDANGSGSNRGVANGIRYAADNGANVINLSLGGSTPDTTIQSAIQYAFSRGVVVVMAAGNDGANAPGYPARYATAYGIAVGAVDINNQFASFSDKAGTTVLDYVAAPGVTVYSSVHGGGYAYYSGTSMATPHVAGVAALILSANRNLTPAQVESLLTSTANPNIVRTTGISSPGSVTLGITSLGFEESPVGVSYAPQSNASVDIGDTSEPPLRIAVVTSAGNDDSSEPVSDDYFDSGRDLYRRVTHLEELDLNGVFVG